MRTCSIRFAARILGPLFFLSATLCPGAPSIRVDPPTLAWDSNRWVEVTVSNLAPGARVALRYHLDLDGNGVTDPGDPLIAAYDLQDGATNRFGAASIADDEDGLSNGVLRTRISFHSGGYDLRKAAGTYVWSAWPTGAAVPAEAAFTVTPPAGTAWITGMVRDFIPPSNVVAGVYVVAEMRFPHAGYPCASWSDTSGAFRIDLPAGLPLSAVADVFAVRPGYLSADTGPSDEPLSLFAFTNSLSAGENALPHPLRVVSAAPGLLAGFTGVVRDPEGGGLAGVLVEAESDNDDDDLLAISITDTAGVFSVLYPPNEELLSIYFTGPLISQRGLVGDVAEVPATGDVAGIVLQASYADVLARSRVTVTPGGAGVAGAEVEFECDNAAASSWSIEDGAYETALPGGLTCGAWVSGESIAPLGYIALNDYATLTLPASGVFTGAPFLVQSGFLVSGTVYDPQTNALSGGYAVAYPSNQWNWAADAELTPGGSYELLLPSGTYRIAVMDVAGHLDQVYDGHATWEWDDGPVYDPVTVSDADVTGIDFYLAEGAEISGTVESEGMPVEDADLAALQRIWNPGGWWDGQWVGSTRTGPDGTYQLVVPEGTNYVVECRPSSGGYLVPEYYLDAARLEEATPVATAPGAPATGIDFDLEVGGILAGRVVETDGVTPAPYAFVQTWDPATDQYGVGAGANDQGEFTLTLTQGVYRIVAFAEGWPDTYYDGWAAAQRDQADPISVTAAATTNILFTLLSASRVEGRVLSGTEPLENIQVEVWQGYDTWLGQNTSDTGGYYSVAVPAATGCVAWARPGRDSVYLDEVWNNTTWENPTYFDVPETATVSGIDFDLTLGIRVEGTVTDQTLAPAGDADVSLRFPDGRWAAGGRTDDNGFYFIHAPGNTSYVVEARRQLPHLHPAMYYDASPALAGATVFTPSPGTVLGTIDITLQPGCKIEGYLLRTLNASMNEPAPNGELHAEDEDHNTYDPAFPDGSGWYELSAPRHRPMRFRYQAMDCQPEYAMDVTAAGDATLYQPAAFSTVRLDIVLHPWTHDTDGDGLTDVQEDVRPDNVWNPAEDLSSWTNRDTDADGFDDRTEVQHTGTNPADGSDYFRCGPMRRLSGGLAITWRSATGMPYRLDRATRLRPENWTDIGGGTGTGSWTTILDPAGGTSHHYRVRMP